MLDGYTAWWVVGLKGHDKQGEVLQSSPDPLTAAWQGTIGTAHQCGVDISNDEGASGACGLTALNLFLLGRGGLAARQARLSTPANPSPVGKYLDYGASAKEGIADYAAEVQRLEAGGVGPNGSRMQPFLPIFRENGGQFQALTKSNNGTGPARWTNVDAKPSEVVNGNSLEASGPHDIYVIRARADQTLPGGGTVKAGQVLHFGETGRGAQVRGAEWIKKLRVEQGIKAYMEELRTVEGKAAARPIESRYISTYEKVFGKRPGFEDADGNWVEIQKSYH